MNFGHNFDNFVNYFTYLYLKDILYAIKAEIHDFFLYINLYISFTKVIDFSFQIIHNFSQNLYQLDNLEKYKNYDMSGYFLKSGDSPKFDQTSLFLRQFAIFYL